MPEERDIEKTLRAWAKRRREDAGAPVELHPATRKLLQAEVARLKGGPPRQLGLLARLLWGSPLRLALNLSAFAVLLFAAAVFLPQLRHAPTSASAGPAVLAENMRELANNSPNSPNSPPPSVASDKPTLSPPVPAIELQSSLRKDNSSRAEPASNQVALADNLTYNTFKAPPAPSAPSAAPAAKNLLSVDNSSYKAPEVSSAAAPAVGPATPAALDQEKLAENGPPVQSPASTKGLASAHTYAQQLSWMNSVTNADRRNGYGGYYAGQPMLNNFRTEQTAGEFRVIDADGSVYAGNLITSNKTLAVDGEHLSAQTLSFRVSGTNLTYNQPVVFTGQLVLGSQLVVSGQTVGVANGNFDFVTVGGTVNGSGGSFGGGGGGGFGGRNAGADSNGAVSRTNALTFSGTAVQTTLSAGATAPSPQLRVEGRAFIGTNAVEINAVPAAP